MVRQKHYDVELEVAGEVGAGEVPDAIDGVLDGVVEVVDDGDVEPLEQQLQHRVGPYEPGPTRHQDALPFALRSHLRSIIQQKPTTEIAQKKENQEEECCKREREREILLFLNSVFSKKKSFLGLD